MAIRKHWHLTAAPGPGPSAWKERGGPIPSRKRADQLAASVRRFADRPIYVVTCTERCAR